MKPNVMVHLQVWQKSLWSALPIQHCELRVGISSATSAGLGELESA
jgi:hypothetical protein